MALDNVQGVRIHTLGVLPHPLKPLTECLEMKRIGQNEVEFQVCGQPWFSEVAGTNDAAVAPCPGLTSST